MQLLYEEMEAQKKRKEARKREGKRDFVQDMKKRGDEMHLGVAYSKANGD